MSVLNANDPSHNVHFCVFVMNTDYYLVEYLILPERIKWRLSN